MKKIIFLLILIVLVGCKKKYEIVEREGEPDVVFVDNNDNAMNIAVKYAQESLHEFNKAIQTQNPNFSNFALKQRFTTSDGNGEHIWIGEVEFEDGKYFGIVDNIPFDVPQIKLGDTIEVDKDNISDWMYYDKNIVKGGFTIKALRANMTSEEKKRMDEDGLVYE